MSNYRKIDVSTVPDCCLTCADGDWDGEGCVYLSDYGYGVSENHIDDDFTDVFFYVCDDFVRASWAKEEEEDERAFPEIAGM